MIFDCGEPNRKLHAMTSSKVFQEGLFMIQKYRKMEDQKPEPGLTRNQDFAKGRELKP